MTNKSGLADSPFFSIQKELPTPPSPSSKSEPKLTKDVSPLPDTSSPHKTKEPREEKLPSQITTPSNHDTTVSRHHDTMVSRYHDTIVELVRSAVKEFGKEAATHRFTGEEKKAVADIIYAYKAQSIKTSENEIARIAINFIVQDYRENGENSILHKVLKALNK